MESRCKASAYREVTFGGSHDRSVQGVTPEPGGRGRKPVEPPRNSLRKDLGRFCAQ